MNQPLYVQGDMRQDMSRYKPSYTHGTAAIPSPILSGLHLQEPWLESEESRVRNRNMFFLPGSVFFNSSSSSFPQKKKTHRNLKYHNFELARFLHSIVWVKTSPKYININKYYWNKSSPSLKIIFQLNGFFISFQMLFIIYDYYYSNIYKLESIPIWIN